MSDKHLAAIDLGTNSFHLVVVRPQAGGRFEIVGDEKESVRLGSGGGDMGHIAPDALERGIAALKRFVKIARTHNAEIRAVATSALREANNRDDFLLRARKECELEIEVIPGTEEARLIYLGILQALPLYDRRILMIDIGGGSTEFLVGTGGRPEYAVSRKLGAIRLKDRFFSTEPLKKSQIEECRHFVRVQLASVVDDVNAHGFEQAVGSSGTIETLAHMAALAARPPGAPEDVDPTDLSLRRDDLDRIVERILDMPTHHKRAKLPGLDEKRSDIIVGGAILLQEIFWSLSIREMLISPYALREGVIHDSLLRRSGRGAVLTDIRGESVRQLAERMLGHDSAEMRSSAHVASLALSIRDQLIALYRGRGFEEHDPFLLRSAALLHNTGMAISHSAHHKHSYYIIKHSESLLGFTGLEIETVALIARYHRKAAPSRKHPEFATLPEALQRTVRFFSGILRIAIGLDRSGKQSVKEVVLRPGDDALTFVLHAVRDFPARSRDLSLEIWAAETRCQILEEVLGRRIRFETS